jgi:acyl carrier protein
LPLTPNGKIDRKALPEPSIETTTGTQLVTPTEELLASLWASVLKLKAISSDDNFFELGGHSLLATQLIARIRDAFEVELPVRAVFEAPSLSQLASQLKKRPLAKSSYRPFQHNRLPRKKCCRLPNSGYGS